MSFKRDGDDSGLLQKLQHRRVAEMLGEHIPDDEAKLLSNGRLTCTVCSRKPIFDTIQMLSLHRRGKKHLYELSRYLEFKTHLEHRKAKQSQRSFLKTDQVTIAPEPSSSLSLVSYIKSGGKRKPSSHLLSKRISLDVAEACDRGRSSLNSSTGGCLSANSQVRRYLKSLSRKRPLERTVAQLRESYGGKVSQGKGQAEPSRSEGKKPERLPCSGRDVSCRVRLLESGWVQDESGKWAKDPNVEFDSDEELPCGCP